MRWTLTIGLAALLWAASVRTGPVPSDAVTTIAGADVCTVERDSRGPNDTNQQWRDDHYAIAVVTESVWKSAPVHAGLSATRDARIFEPAGSVSAPDPPAASTPLYLRHTPLLI